jgi:hypothetical protein
MGDNFIILPIVTSTVERTEVLNSAAVAGDVVSGY